MRQLSTHLEELLPSVPGSHIRRVLTFSLTVMFGAGLLAACSSSPGHKAAANSAANNQEAGVPPGSIPKDTTTTRPQAGAEVGAVCKKAQLGIAQSAADIHGTDDLAVYTITNNSSSRCSLNGYPALLIVGSLGPLATNVTNGGVAGASKLSQHDVTLAPHGGQASIETSWSPTAPGSCPVGEILDITLPGVTGGISVTSFVKACGGLINVSAVQPNVVLPS
jgi:hypothetical protein